MHSVLVLTRDPKLSAIAEAACQASGRTSAMLQGLGQLANVAIAVDWSDLVIDPTVPGAQDAVEKVTIARGRRVIGVLETPDSPPIRRAHAMVSPAILGRVLQDLGASRGVSAQTSIEHLLGTTLLGGALDDAIDAAAHEIAVAFRVARCIISEHVELPGLARSDGATFDASAWTGTAQHCRTATRLETTLIVPAANEPGACDSYLAVPLESARGSAGFIALFATGTRVFTAEDRAALLAISARLSNELRWRAIHARTIEDLERAASGPAFDPLLGVWNRAALDQIAHAYASSAKRNKLVLTAMAVRVADLEGVNTRFGMTIGDRVLRRIADSLKGTLRGEDVVGRFSGAMIVVLLQGTALDDARRVAERVQAMFQERPVDAIEGVQVPIETAIGLSELRADEAGSQLLARTATATKRAPDNVVSVVSGPTTLTGNLPHASDASDAQLRRTLGGSYRLRHEINRGGMGVVYRADDLALERPVAVKMLRPELAQNDELVRHLRREAAMLARVHHRNLVQIYNFGQSDGDCYFVMELVEGETLQQTIERYRAQKAGMPLADLITIVDQIASALDALHERGIVHRDVKPANFIRDPFTERSVLVDVGIAHRFGELSKQAGTPGFMAPEVIQGVAASARSDVYGLAASIFKMATLSSPWGEGEPIEIIMRQCSEPPPFVSTLRPELAPIDDILAAAMSFDIEERPSSAGKLARALQRALDIAPRTSPRSLRGTENLDNSEAASRTRGIVFRAVPRVLGVTLVNRLRDAIGQEHPELADALAQCAPLGWAPSEQFVQLLATAPERLAIDATKFARDVARVAVRASFRTFFPASPETLHPDHTLSAFRGIWSRYQSWGKVAAIPVSRTETTVQLSETLRVPAVCEWTASLLETLVTLSGGRSASAAHTTCECNGAASCTFQVTWLE